MQRGKPVAARSAKKRPGAAATAGRGKSSQQTPRLSDVRKNRKGAQRTGKTDHDPFLVWRSISDVRPAPENDEIYRPSTLDDPEFRALIASVSRDGIREPLVITQDGYLVSGHRRLAAAEAADLEQVPCRIVPYNRSDDLDRFVRELREHNRQRDKSRDERIREALIDVNADEAHARLRAHRKAASRIAAPELILGTRRRRSAISPARRPFLAALRRVLDERREFWPLSDRSVHYALLNDPPLIHASKPESKYANDHRSYRALTELLTRARLSYEISFSAINDPTRPVTTWRVWSGVAPYVTNVLQRLFDGYARDLMRSQPNHVEIVVEKNSVEPVIRPVASEFTIPLTSGRGYASLPPRATMVERFQNGGKTNLIVVFVTDFDPEGESIAESFARSLRDDFHVRNVQAVKAALTAEQIKAFALPPALKAKAGSSRRAGFVRKHGEHVWELEALHPADLQRVVRESVESVIDVDAYNQEIETEKQDARYLTGLRKTAVAAIGDLANTRADGDD